MREHVFLQYLQYCRTYVVHFQVLEAKHNGIIAQVYNTHVLHSIFCAFKTNLQFAKLLNCNYY